MAFQTTIESYDWTSDEGEATAAAAYDVGQFDTHVYLSNHSYGYSYGWRWDGSQWVWTGTGTDQNAYDADFGQYSWKSRNLDDISYNAPYYLVFWAAGNENNDGPNNGNTVSIGGSSVTYDSSIHPQNDGDYKSGFETIGDHGVAKNLITVGAANDAVTSGQRDPAKATIASFSSTGPTDDGRIKPDLVANGVGLYSTYDNSNTAYNSISGTSMASPNATGSAALLIDLYRDLFGSTAAMRSSTLKALLIHTATDIGNPGPDYTYGWGLVDVKTAADLLDEAATYPDKLSLVEDQLNTSTPTQTYNFFWDGASEVRATLSWTDPSNSEDFDHDNRTPDLVNDLNLKLIAPDGTEHFPFVMPFVGTWTVASMSQNATTGVNNTDNVEQVLIASPAQTGEWTIEVSYTGSLTNNVQDYGLVVTGSSFNPGGNVGFSSDNYTVDENAGTATITVDRIGGNSGAISVDYATSDGTAVAGSDYTGTSGTLSWADGDSTSKTFSVSILDDTVHEDPEETLSLTLSNPVDAEITGTNPATLAIFEDDNQVPAVDAGTDQEVFLSGTVWSPNSLSPDLWLDADDSNTLTLNGSTVSQWNDKSGNDRHATQATSGSQPTFTSGGLNSMDVLTFDGSADFFNLDLDFMAGVDHSVFVVTKPTTYTNIYGAANSGSGSNSLHVGFRDSSTYRMNFWSNDWYGTPTNFQADTANLLNYHWVSGDSKEIFANGKSEGTNNSAGIVGTMSGGGRISNVTGHGYYGGDIAEFIAFGKSLTPTERQELEGFLAHKWGTANLLASDHPYKSSGPDNYTAEANLDGTVSDGDGDPLTTTWSVVSGPASVTFADASAVDTAATFTTAGTYILRLTADDGYTTTSDDVVVTVFEENTVTYTVDFQTDGTAGASLTGDTSQTVSEGGSASEVTANAPTDYHFVEWTESGTSYSTDNPLSVTNVSSDMTLTANFAKTASIAMADDGSITEQSEDGEAILVTLTDSTFADPITPSNWSLSGQPDGVGKGDVTRISDTSVRILLSGNSTTDYDSDITNMSVTCAAAEVANAVAPLSADSGVTFTAFNDAESIEITDDGWIEEGAEDGEQITVVLNGGTFAASLDAANWTVSNLPSGVSKGAVTHVSANVATITLSGNRSGTYGGNDITDVTVSCTTAEYSDSAGGTSLSDNSGVTLRALSSGGVTLQDGADGYAGTRDTYIDYENPDTNYGTATSMVLNNRTSPQQQKKDRHGFLDFDLSSISSGTVITGVTVELTDDGGTAGTIRLYEATGTWDETTATYNNSNGLLGTTEYANASASGTAGSTVNLALNATGIAKVQEWIDNPGANNGFTIQTDLTDNSTQNFRTREHATQADRPTITVTFESSGSSAPEINVQGNGVSIVSGDTTPSSADHTDFGEAFTGGDTVVRTFTIENVGDADLSLSGSPLVDIIGTDAGDFSVSSVPSSPVAAGASTSFELTFTPSGEGLREATVSIANDDADENPYTFAIQGEGVVPAVTYAVTYDGNGNTGGPAPTDSLSPYESGGTVTVLGNSGSLVKTGYSFDGWNTAPDGSGTAYAPASTFSISADTTLYAQWTANSAGFTVDPTTATVDEAGGTDTFTVVLDSQPASDVVFDVTSSDINEATVAPASLTFTPDDWDSPQTVTITGVDDDTTTEDSATISVGVNAGSSADAYDALSDQTVAVTITNDDIPGINVGAISGDTDESGSTATFTVVLGTQPAADVTIDLSTSDTGEGTVSPASLTLGTADWNSPQTVTVTGVDDAETDGDQAYTIVLAAASSTDPDYDGIDPADVAVTNLDNESIVTYYGNGNDGGSAPADQTKVFGTELTLSEAGSLTRLGFDFGGWNTAADGSGTSFAAGASYSDEADLTLYAQWDSGPAVIYEPFAQTAGGLGGQSGGVGLSGNWSVNQIVDVVNPVTLTYGDLPEAGGQADLPNNNGVDAWITTSTGLADSNLLDDGATLWFSMVYQKTAGSSSNEHSGFAFGTDRVDADHNGARMDSGYGLGFYTQGSSVSVATWNNSGQNAGGSHTVTYSTPTLIVGKIEWGATAGDDETITLYTPSLTDLLNLGTGVTATTAGFDQTLLNTVSFTQRNSGGTQTYDELRFGATYEAVIGQGSTSTFTVTYDGNGSDGGTVPVDATEYSADATVTVLGNTGDLTKTAYHFAGWNTASDGSGASYLADESFTITENVTLYAQWTANSAPVADDQSVTTAEDNAIAITLTASDADADSLTYTVTTQPVNGALSGTAPDLTYTPAAGYTGSDSFTFTANDGTVDSNTATVSITVQAPFDDWAGEGSTPGDDSSGDGIADGLAWVLGASDPSSDATDLLPTADTTSEPDYFIFTYRRSAEAHNDSGTTIDVIYGDDMSSWNTAEHDGTDIIISETDDHYGTGVDRVEVKINWGLVSGDEIFTRLRVEITP